MYLKMNKSTFLALGYGTKSKFVSTAVDGGCSEILNLDYALPYKHNNPT